MRQTSQHTAGVQNVEMLWLMLIGHSPKKWPMFSECSSRKATTLIDNRFGQPLDAAKIINPVPFRRQLPYETPYFGQVWQEHCTVLSLSNLIIVHHKNLTNTEDQNDSLVYQNVTSLHFNPIQSSFWSKAMDCIYFPPQFCSWNQPGHQRPIKVR